MGVQRNFIPTSCNICTLCRMELLANSLSNGTATSASLNKYLHTSSSTAVVEGATAALAATTTTTTNTAEALISDKRPFHVCNNNSRSDKTVAASLLVSVTAAATSENENGSNSSRSSADEDVTTCTVDGFERKSSSPLHRTFFTRSTRQQQDDIEQRTLDEPLWQSSVIISSATGMCKDASSKRNSTTHSDVAPNLLFRRENCTAISAQSTEAEAAAAAASVLLESRTTDSRTAAASSCSPFDAAAASVSYTRTAPCSRRNSSDSQRLLLLPSPAAFPCRLPHFTPLLGQVDLNTAEYSDPRPLWGSAREARTKSTAATAQAAAMKEEAVGPWTFPEEALLHEPEFAEFGTDMDVVQHQQQRRGGENFEGSSNVNSVSSTAGGATSAERVIFTNSPISEEEQQAIDAVLLQLRSMGGYAGLQLAAETAAAAKHATVGPLGGVRTVVKSDLTAGKAERETAAAAAGSGSGVDGALSLRESAEKQENIYWIEQYILRFLYCSGFDVLKAVELMRSCLSFRLTQLPVYLDEVVREIRDEGVAYWHGRDKALRPLLIIRVDRMQQEQQRSRGLEDGPVTRALVFSLEYFLKYLCVAGRVETWVILCDCSGTSLSSFPVPLLYRLLSLLQASYRGRLHRLYLLNTPRFFHLLTRPLLFSFPANSSKKLRIFASAGEWNEERRRVFAPHQLEVKYGGTQPDIQKKWFPYRFYPGPFDPQTTHEQINWKSNPFLHREVSALHQTGFSLHTSPISSIYCNTSRSSSIPSSSPLDNAAECAPDDMFEKRQLEIRQSASACLQKQQKQEEEESFRTPVSAASSSDGRFAFWTASLAMLSLPRCTKAWLNKRYSCCESEETRQDKQHQQQKQSLPQVETASFEQSPGRREAESAVAGPAENFNCMSSLSDKKAEVSLQSSTLYIRAASGSTSTKEAAAPASSSSSVHPSNSSAAATVLYSREGDFSGFHEYESLSVCTVAAADRKRADRGSSAAANSSAATTAKAEGVSSTAAATGSSRSGGTAAVTATATTTVSELEFATTNAVATRKFVTAEKTASEGAAAAEPEAEEVVMMTGLLEADGTGQCEILAPELHATSSTQRLRERCQHERGATAGLAADLLGSSRTASTLSVVFTTKTFTSAAPEACPTVYSSGTSGRLRSKEVPFEFQSNGSVSAFHKEALAVKQNIDSEAYVSCKQHTALKTMLTASLSQQSAKPARITSAPPKTEFAASLVQSVVAPGTQPIEDLAQSAAWANKSTMSDSQLTVAPAAKLPFPRAESSERSELFGKSSSLSVQATTVPPSHADAMESRTRSVPVRADASSGEIKCVDALMTTPTKTAVCGITRAPPQTRSAESFSSKAARSTDLPKNATSRLKVLDAFHMNSGDNVVDQTPDRLADNSKKASSGVFVLSGAAPHALDNNTARSLKGEKTTVASHIQKPLLKSFSDGERLNSSEEGGQHQKEAVLLRQAGAPARNETSFRKVAFVTRSEFTKEASILEEIETYGEAAVSTDEAELETSQRKGAARAATPTEVATIAGARSCIYERQQLHNDVIASSRRAAAITPKIKCADSSSATPDFEESDFLSKNKKTSVAALAVVDADVAPSSSFCATVSSNGVTAAPTTTEDIYIGNMSFEEEAPGASVDIRTRNQSASLTMHKNRSITHLGISSVKNSKLHGIDTETQVEQHPQLQSSCSCWRSNENDLRGVNDRIPARTINNSTRSNSAAASYLQLPAKILNPVISKCALAAGVTVKEVSQAALRLTTPTADHCTKSISSSFGSSGDNRTDSLNKPNIVSSLSVDSSHTTALDASHSEVICEEDIARDEQSRIITDNTYSAPAAAVVLKGKLDSDSIPFSLSKKMYSRTEYVEAASTQIPEYDENGQTRIARFSEESESAISSCANYSNVDASSNPCSTKNSTSRESIINICEIIKKAGTRFGIANSSGSFDSSSYPSSVASNERASCVGRVEVQQETAQGARLPASVADLTFITSSLHDSEKKLLLEGDAAVTAGRPAETTAEPFLHGANVQKCAAEPGRPAIAAGLVIDAVAAGDRAPWHEKRVDKEHSNKRLPTNIEFASLSESCTLDSLPDQQHQEPLLATAAADIIGKRSASNSPSRGKSIEGSYNSHIFSNFDTNYKNDSGLDLNDSHKNYGVSENLFPESSAFMGNTDSRKLQRDTADTTDTIFIASISKNDSNASPDNTLTKQCQSECMSLPISSVHTTVKIMQSIPETITSRADLVGSLSQSTSTRLIKDETGSTAAFVPREPFPDAYFAADSRRYIGCLPLETLQPTLKASISADLPPKPMKKAALLATALVIRSIPKTRKNCTSRSRWRRSRVFHQNCQSCSPEADELNLIPESQFFRYCTKKSSAVDASACRISNEITMRGDKAPEELALEAAANREIDQTCISRIKVRSRRHMLWAKARQQQQQHMETASCALELIQEQQLQQAGKEALVLSAKREVIKPFLHRRRFRRAKHDRENSELIERYSSVRACAAAVASSASIAASVALPVASTVLRTTSLSAADVCDHKVDVMNEDESSARARKQVLQQSDCGSEEVAAADDAESDDGNILDEDSAQKALGRRPKLRTLAWRLLRQRNRHVGRILEHGCN